LVDLLFYLLFGVMPERLHPDGSRRRY
jgi:hypothetical protein